jgi:hypothetical protein
LGDDWLKIRNAGGGTVRLTALNPEDEAVCRVDVPGGGYALLTSQQARDIAEVLVSLAAQAEERRRPRTKESWEDA